MHTFSEIVLAIFLIADLALAGAGRLKYAIRLVALQGWIVGILPVFLWNWQANGCPGMRIWLIGLVNAVVKGVLLPILLSYAVRKARTRREVEPIVSFQMSRFVVFLMAVGGFAIGRLLHIHETIASELAIPVAFTTMGTGLLLICARKKAITQVLGFLVLENGISLLARGFFLSTGLLSNLGSSLMCLRSSLFLALRYFKSIAHFYRPIPIGSISWAILI
jgi:hydrogenase-4 component E